VIPCERLPRQRKPGSENQLTGWKDDGIVVGKGQKGDVFVATVPSALSARLGPEASRNLVDLLDAEQRDWKEQVLSAAVDRFERRLIEEASKLRVEMSDFGSTLRQEIAKDRFELLKWMFLFWVSQLAAMSAIMSFLLRRV
jgi:hypothetical protein